MKFWPKKQTQRTYFVQILVTFTWIKTKTFWLWFWLASRNNTPSLPFRFYVTLVLDKYADMEGSQPCFFVLVWTCKSRFSKAWWWSSLLHFSAIISKCVCHWEELGGASLCPSWFIFTYEYENGMFNQADLWHHIFTWSEYANIANLLFLGVP